MASKKAATITAKDFDKVRALLREPGGLAVTDRFIDGRGWIRFDADGIEIGPVFSEEPSTRK